MNFCKDMLLLYGVTGRGCESAQTLYQQIEAALMCGVTLVQLREKNLSYADYVEEAVKVKALCHRYGVPLIINDRVDVAIKSGADGVHVGIEDTPVRQIRQKVPKDFIIGATAKTVEQAQDAEKAGADYLGVGAVFPSPSKKNVIRITLGQLKDICLSVSIPTVAIGGINLENVMKIQGCGMDGIAVISAIFAADDIQNAAAKLKEKARAAIQPL